MSSPKHDLIRRFFECLSSGHLPDDLFTVDMTFATSSSGNGPKAQLQGAAKLLSMISNGTLTYYVDALTVEDDRAAAEVTSKAVLSTGEDFQNVHVFTFRIRDGKISHCTEFMDQDKMKAKIFPLIQAAMAKMGK